MTHEVSTHVVKIDLVDILDNVLNQRYWDRKWCIFDYNGVVINISLQSIDIEYNKVSLRIEVLDNNAKNHWDRSYVTTESITRDLMAKRSYRAFENNYMIDIHNQVDAMVEFVDHDAKRLT